MSVDTLLSRLDKVKQTGRNKWIALCPAHADKNPSLSVTEADDGKTLIKCWAGCGAADILASVNLEFSDLFPDKRPHHSKRERQPYSPRDILKVMAKESLIAAIAASQVAQGKSIADEDLERLLTASERLQRAAEVAHGKL